MSDVSSFKLEIKGQDYTPALIPQGSVKLRVKQMVIKASKAGAPMLETQAVLANPVPSTKPGTTLQGDKVYYIFHILDPSEKMLQYRDPREEAQQLFCAVFKADVNTVPDIDTPNCVKATGKEFNAVVSHRDNNGTLQEEFSAFTAV